MPAAKLKRKKIFPFYNRRIHDDDFWLSFHLICKTLFWRRWIINERGAAYARTLMRAKRAGNIIRQPLLTPPYATTTSPMNGRSARFD